MLRAFLLLAFTAPLLAQECTYVVTPVSLSLPATGDLALAPTLKVDVSRGGCAWTARSNVAWITVSFGQTGSNDGTVGIRVDDNREATTRTGSLTIAGQTVSVLQSAANCTFTLTPNSAIANPAGGNGSFQVATTCNWQALTNVDWIDVTSPAGGRGVGSGAVTYAARANSGASRTGTIQVGPLRFTVQQSAATCTQVLSSMQAGFTAAGGNGVIQVTSNCAWTAFSNATWIAVTGGASGSSDGTVAYSVQASTDAQARTGTIRIGNQTFTVTQSGAACAVSLSPTSASVPAGGGAGVIAVASTCAWTAASSDAWISIAPAAASVGYTVNSNSTGQARTGSIAIGNRVFSITQAAGCAVTLSPETAQVGVGGASGSFLVSGQAGCTWTVAAAADWIALNIGSGQGSGTVIYTAAANDGPARAAAIAVNNRSFTVSQAGTLPSFTAAGILNAASFEGGTVAPGLIVTIFGAALGPAALVEATVDPVARAFPTELAGTRVLFDGVAAPLIYSSAKVLAAVTPFGVAGRQNTRVEVERLGVRSAAVFMPVAATAPAIFTQSAQGFGPGAILNRDFTVNGPANPAAPGSFVVVYATGGGVVTPATADGKLAEGGSSTQAPVRVEVDSQPVEVLYAGGAPDLVAGVLQVNIRLPANLRPGDLPLVIRAGDAASQTRVTVSVR